MSSVDNRIVKMQMENSQFSSAAKNTMRTLDQLSNSLKLSDGTRGLDNIASKVKNVDMSSLASSVDMVKDRFSVLDIVGVAALVNITNSAINAGKNLVKSLTIDPVMDGLREYETKMDAIQTILTNTSAKGTTLDQVNDALKELNDYSDLTIYNFAQMTDNIGKATAAGVGLEDAVTFVKGLSNVAAGFGVDATRMAGATYQMTQALSAGVIKLQDWKSLEQSGMGGQMLQDSLVETAKEMGVFVDTSVPFRESLESSWLSSDVFIKTMDKMAKDPSLTAAAQNVTSFTKLIGTMQETVGSGWAMSWEHIFGNKEQSTALFTSISNGFQDISNSMADYRNTALETWNKTGGREAVLNGLKKVLESIGRVLGPIYESFKKIIDPWNGERLISLSKGFESFADRIKVSDETMGLISRTADGVFSALSIVGKVVGSVAGAFMNLLPLLSPVIDGFLNITATIGDYIVKLNDFIGSSSVFQNAFGLISKVVTKASELVGKGLEKIAGWFGKFGEMDLSGLKAVGSKIVDCFKPVETMANVIDKVLTGLKNTLSKFIDYASSFAEKVWNTMSEISSAIIDNIGGKGTGLQNIMNVGLIGAIILGIKKVIGVFQNLGDSVGGIVDSVVDIFDGVKDSLEAFQNNLKAGTLMKIAIAIGILAAALIGISVIDSGKLVSSLTAMGVMFAQLVAAMTLLNGVGGGVKLGATLMLLATAIAILSHALKRIAEIPMDNIVRGLAGLAGMLTALVATSKFLETSSKGMVKTAIAMVVIGKAINILAEAVDKLGTLDTNVMTKGLIGVGVLLTQMSLFMRMTDFSGMGVMKATGILIMSQALVVLSKAVDKLGGLDKNKLIKGLGSVGIALGEIAIFSRMIGKPSKMVSTAVSVTILSGALLILSKVINNLGTLDYDVLSRGLTAMALALVSISVAMRLMPKNMMMQAISITILSGALSVLDNVINNMGTLPWETIKKGLIAMGGSLGILAVALNVMRGTLGGAAAVLVAAGALAILTPVLKSLGNMSIKSIAKSLITLAGAFTIIGVAGLLLTPLAVPLLALSGAIALLGVATLAAGAGIAALALGLGSLAVSGAAGISVMVLAINSIIGLIPTLATTLAKGFLNMLTVIVENTGILASAIGALIIVLADAFIKAAPKILELLGVLISGIVQTLVESIPVIVDGVMQLIISILTTLKDNLPTIVSLVIETLVNLITSVLTELANAIPKIASGIVDIIVAMIAAIGDGSARIVDAMFDLVIKMINSFANTISTKMPEVRQAVKNVVKAIVEELKNCVTDALGIGGDIIAGLCNGITNAIGAVAGVAKTIGSKLLGGVKSFLGIHSPSREFAKVGMWCDKGLVGGINKYSGSVETAAVSVADGALSGMKSAMSNIDKLVNFDNVGQPTIRPVMDLSDIQNGTNSIDEMLHGNYAIKASAATARQAMTGFLTGNMESSNPSQTNNNTTNTTEITNNFNIQGDNPTDIANEISKILQKQVDRRNAVWA